MNSNNPIYNNRTSGTPHGDVFTRREVVVYMLDLLKYTSDRNLSDVRILEPSCGNGEFLLEITSRLEDSSIKFGFDFNIAFHKSVLACDIDKSKVTECVHRLKDSFPVLHDVEECILCEDFLLSEHGFFDVIVGNPPYIRYEEIPIIKRNIYKKKFNTFHYRTDIYVLFFEKTLLMLKTNGLHCFICANRWMKNQYGKKLRQMIASEIKIHRIIDMEQADAFHEKVLAYPAITLLENATPGITFCFGKALSITDLDNMCLTTLKVPYNDDWSRIFSQDETFCNMIPIEKQGFKIGIGIATGADSVFVSQTLYDIVEHELLMPALSARNLSGDTFLWDGRYLLNPYQKDGKLIQLENYPLAKAYFESHRERLSNRHKALKNPSKWYATIDSIKPHLLTETKILLPDISGNSFVFIDKGEFYPQHNLYYITGNSERSLQILAAFLMSDAIKSQLNKMANHMNGGYPRWQSQYLRKLLIPNISEMRSDDKNAIITAYVNRDFLTINKITNRIIVTQSSWKCIGNMHTRQLSFAFKS